MLTEISVILLPQYNSTTIINKSSLHIYTALYWLHKSDRMMLQHSSNLTNMNNNIHHKHICICTSLLTVIPSIIVHNKP